MELDTLPLAGLLDGQTALVTGGARGIGRAVSLYLAKAGAAVCVADLREVDAAKTVDEIAKSGGRAVAVGGDVGKDTDRRAMLTAFRRG